ncbi:hypothetical protein WJX84_008681 [Apatococcus fuscideae]|uniref:ApaG domain-containing protein n=1 Tax=Apatococcus fuscideae TaxID=2026836 RepID=A0AAW1T1J9_9CHLO
MSQNRAVLTVYRGLLRQARLLSEEERLVVRHPVDPEAFRRTNHSWAKPADEICRETLKELAPYLTEVPGQFTRASLSSVIRNSFKSSFNAAQEDQGPLQDTSLRALRTLSDQIAMMQCSTSTTTQGVNVDVTTAPLFQNESIFAFTYRCRIENRGQHKVQLLGRHWQFKNAHDMLVQEVPKGSPGVVGNTPIIPPGDCFEYHSAAHLDTPKGSIQGSFQMMQMDAAQQHFDAFVERTRFHQNGRQSEM